MIYCRNCGEELLEGTKFCPHCGKEVENGTTPTADSQNLNPDDAITQNNDNANTNTNATTSAIPDQKTGSIKTAFGFMIFSIVACTLLGIYYFCFGFIFDAISELVSLFWLIPMTLHINSKKSTKQLSTGFKVCVLLFGNVISGIVLLCQEK